MHRIVSDGFRSYRTLFRELYALWAFYGSADFRADELSVIFVLYDAGIPAHKKQEKISAAALSWQSVYDGVYPVCGRVFPHGRNGIRISQYLFIFVSCGNSDQ